jgi:hypothetical protein
VNAEAKDKLYDELCQTIHEKQRLFSTVLKVRVFITECLSDEEKLLFCKTLSAVLKTSSYETDLVYT